MQHKIKKLPKISLYELAKFSSTPTFGWYFTILSFFITRERRLYNESKLVCLFSFCYSKLEGGITDDGMIWRGSKISLHLFFVRIFKFNWITSKEPIGDDLF